VGITTYMVAHRTSDMSILKIGDTVGIGDGIWIDPILYDKNPTALFKANDISSVPSTIDASSGPTGNGLFLIQETWDSVTIINNADRPLTLNGINTLHSTVSASPEAVINISVNKGAENNPSGFQFDVKHIFPATN